MFTPCGIKIEVIILTVKLFLCVIITLYFCNELELSEDYACSGVYINNMLFILLFCSCLISTQTPFCYIYFNIRCKWLYAELFIARLSKVSVSAY